MKSHSFLKLLVIALGLIISLDQAVVAQQPDLPAGRIREEKSFSSQTHTLPHQVAPQSPDVLLGQPGLSFRYAETFGLVERAFFSDTTHLNFPYGLTTEGTNVWIADTNSNRALKFTSSGAVVQQIGQSGFRYGAAGTDLEWIPDVGVDSGGNVWVVDGNANHIAKFDSAGNLIGELGEMWVWGDDQSHFGGPRSIAFDSVGNIYVSDAGNFRIQIFNSGGTYLNTIGETGVDGSDNAHFSMQRHIAVDSSNRLYVADANNHRVQIYNVSNPSAAAYEATLGVPGEPGSDNDHFAWPMGVAVDANRIYVVEFDNHRVQIFNRTTYAYEDTLGTGTPGTGDNEFLYPSDVAVDSAGNIYIADQVNQRVQQFNSSLAYVRTYGTTGVPYAPDGYHFNRPSGVAVAQSGSIYVTEEWGCRLIKLDASGTPEWALGEPGICFDDTVHFSNPGDVDLDSAGQVYVADSANNRIQIFDSSGGYVNTLGTGFGSGDYEFNFPQGVAVGSNGNIYVADRYNHRVQIYDSSLTLVNSLGVTGEAGTDNAHFNEPYDVDVDSAGNIYVADLSNQRVQVFNSSLAHTLTIGESGVAGNDFGHLSFPTGVWVDAAGRIYVADGWGSRIQVFDDTGAYLTTIGGSGGPNTGAVRQVEGLAFDSAGTLYFAEGLNHRIQKFAPGVPGWMQKNINGFGDPASMGVAALEEGSNNQLYAGTWNWSEGARIWRSSDGSSWTAVTDPGFGSVYTNTNPTIPDLIVFNGQLYAGTGWDGVGGQVWRSPDGTTWTKVVDNGFGDPDNLAVVLFTVFNNSLYACTRSEQTHGLEIWRSATGDSSDWSQVVTNGFDGNPKNVNCTGFAIFNGYLYAATESTSADPDGIEIWRTNNGDDWTQANITGFGDLENFSAGGLAIYKGFLYVGTINFSTGAQIWRTSSGTNWEQVTGDGLGDINNQKVELLFVFGNDLYAGTKNTQTGAEIWRTSDGSKWFQINPDGFGDSNNMSFLIWSNGILAFKDSLYLGTYNPANGGELWQLLDQLYLPILRR